MRNLIVFKVETPNIITKNFFLVSMWAVFDSQVEKIMVRIRIGQIHG